MRHAIPCKGFLGSFADSPRAVRDDARRNIVNHLRGAGVSEPNRQNVAIQAGETRNENQGARVGEENRGMIITGGEPPPPVGKPKNAWRNI